MIAAFAVLVVAGLGIGGCQSHTQAGSGNPGTTAGSYTVTMTAVSGTASSSVNIPLTVQ